MTCTKKPIWSGAFYCQERLPERSTIFNFQHLLTPQIDVLSAMISKARGYKERQRQLTRKVKGFSGMSAESK